MNQFQDPSIDRDLSEEGESSSLMMAMPLFFTAIAIGAASMYLFDPRQGRTRRAWIGQKGIRAKNNTVDQAGKISRDLKNRAKGVAARAGIIGNGKDETSDLGQKRDSHSFEKDQETKVSNMA